MSEAQNSFLDALKTARDVADLVSAPRLVFQQFFDDYVAGLNDPAMPRGFAQAVVLAQLRARLAGIADLDPARLEDAVALALAMLGSRDAIGEACFAAAAAGILSAQGTASRPPGSPPKTLTEAVGRSVPEKMTDPNADMPDPDILVPAILLARKRLCKVVAEKNNTIENGTGFLIGPSAVLTNFHVVEGLTPGGPLQDGEALRVIFDYSRTSGMPTGPSSVVHAQQDWCIAASRQGTLQPEGAEDRWWMDEAIRRAWASSLDDSLDYAVIRLQGTPGLQRGWYKLSDRSEALAGSCWLLHHPLGDGRSISGGSFQFENDPPSPRVFHSGPTVLGSSGALVLDRNGQPAALHHLGIGKNRPGADGLRVPQDVVNVAIPLSAIARSLAATLPKIVSTVEHHLEGGCIDRRRPVFGRQSLIRQLSLLAKRSAVGAGERGKQVLVVRPPTSTTQQRIGKSFTLDILKHVFPGPENIYVSFSADTVPVGAKEMAARILTALSPHAFQDMPEQETTDPAYAKRLVVFLREILAEQFPGKTIWLVIDDLDVHPLTDAGGRLFLDVLYQDIRIVEQMRIVLIGLNVSLYHIPEEARLDCPIIDEDVRDMENLIRIWLDFRGLNRRPLDAQVASLIAKVLVSYAGGRTPLPNLADFTVNHLDEALESYFC
ncbi:serine protease [Azospirillum sp. A26]|uniref:trypsin-like serine peptidase n=1 Tax=Azospirillum sp. A26 TaxID=3160607 RepID=UPI00366AFAFC